MSRITVVSYMSLNGMTSSDQAGNVNDWLPYDESLDQVYIDAYKAADAVLFGRRSFEALRQYWPTPAADKEHAELIRLINTMPKIVFSRTMTDLQWAGSRVEAAFSRERIEALKSEFPKGMLAIGSGTLVLQLAELGLVDELCLIVAPVVLASGQPYFRELGSNVPLQFLKAEPYGKGNLVVRYGRTTE